MILSKDQINRYLRNIIIPEISGSGQKKITQSKIYLYASTVQEASSLIYYLAASGIGYISCYFKDSLGYEKLFKNIQDLNSDVVIELANNELSIVYSDSLFNEGFVIRILISKYVELQDNLISFSCSHNHSKFIPTIVSINNGWNGFLQTFSNQEDFNELLIKPLPIDSNSFGNNVQEKEGNVLSNCVLSALTSVECIKLSLNLGKVLDKPLYFNLLSMKFYKWDNKVFYLAITDFLKNSSYENNLPKNSENYNDKKLSNSKVLIVGTGGLGSPVAYALSSLGVGTIGVIDYDSVEISNLNRQILHATSRIGMPKVESAEAFISDLNPDVKVVTYNTSINIQNALDITSDYDVIIDAVDNFPTRYLLNDSCFFANKPLVDAAVVRFHGLIMTILPNKGPCYRCAFPLMPNQKPGTSCSEAGVLGPVPGFMGFLQASEVVKLLLDIGDTLSNRIIYYDALDSDFDTISMNKSTNCNLCGAEPTITELVDYNNSCESTNNKEMN
ncbi:ThiF family adenylyltransferase [Clostridium estertheticum]|uniref:ThiF family adenylyltransferase n=1 Tax=Clostridium estertheticum TaxID=238834 RepID=UPI0013E98F94|nr:ThiF family adenylyltransferase [Clostridium estertheticum]MBZ9686486.1 ThiF family adenylyltransferase [Clostridium estertheticum]